MKFFLQCWVLLVTMFTALWVGYHAINDAVIAIMLATNLVVALIFAVLWWFPFGLGIATLTAIGFMWLLKE
jgi:hypothetical protein